jgi:Protein of unknown function (DUF3662)/FHA domain
VGVFDRIERKLEGVVSDGFARAFKGDVQPVEIAARLQRELDARARLLSRERKLVPNDFTVKLSTHDYDNLFPYSGSITAEIMPQLRDYAGAAGYVFNGPITIEYVLDESLPTGRFTVASEAVAAVDAAQPFGLVPQQARKASLVLEVNGIRHPLVPPGFTIGRGADADIRINDPGISRQHARIVVIGEPGAFQISIEDAGSTNGIIVNGERTRSAVLTEGSRIEMGNTRLLVRTPVHDV